MPYKTLFIDIGGVLLTNGWDRHSRQRACETFQLDQKEFDSRHQLTFDTYEMGKISLDEYLQRVIFYEERAFTLEDFKKFMFKQSKPFPEMLALISELKKKYALKIVVVSNEGRELNSYRIKTFKLDQLVDIFVSSSFVHLRKPDKAIFHLALDLSQTPIQEILYIEDRPLFVEIAESLGIKSIRHIDYNTTKIKLAELGLI